MTKTILKIDGMMCGMCEAHVQNAIRKAGYMNVKANHHSGNCVVISEESIDPEHIKEPLEKLGYRILETHSEPYEKKGFFSFFHRKK